MGIGCKCIVGALRKVDSCPRSVHEDRSEAFACTKSTICWLLKGRRFAVKAQKAEREEREHLAVR